MSENVIQNRVILDCDPGMDDSMAIVMAEKSPTIDLLGVVSSHGNYPIEVTTINALKTLEMLGADDVPVVKGHGKPLMRVSPSDPFSHGDDGQANNNLPVPSRKVLNVPSSKFIVDQVNAFPGEITYVVTGPMTNLAAAIIADPELPKKLRRVVAISGAFALNAAAYANATGDTPQSEWNVYVDPEAAKIVYESVENLYAIGLDVATHFDVDFSDDQLSSLKASRRPEAQFLSTAVDFVTNRGYGAYCTIIDCMAIASVLEPDIIEFFEGHVGIETMSELCRGMTVLDSRHHHVWEHLPIVHIARTADYGRFLNLVTATVLQGEGV